MDHHARRHRRRAGLRRHRHRPRPARAVDEGVRDRAQLLHRRGARVRRLGAALPRPRLRDRVLRGLADGVQPLDGQPVRLHRADGRAEGAAAAPAGGADGRHHPGADLPRHLHRAGLPADQQLLVGLLRLRRVPRLHGLQPGEELPHARGRAPRGQPGGEVRPVAPERRRGVPRPQALVPAERRPGRLADADRDHRARHHRHPVRARLDPGDLRHHPGALPGVHRQRVRADGPAAALLPARRAAEAAGLPVAGPVVHPRVHRREAGAARPARERAALHQRRRARRRTGDLVAAEPGRDHPDPGRSPPWPASLKDRADQRAAAGKT